MSDLEPKETPKAGKGRKSPSFGQPRPSPRDKRLTNGGSALPPAEFSVWPPYAHGVAVTVTRDPLPDSKEQHAIFKMPPIRGAEDDGNGKGRGNSDTLLDEIYRRVQRIEFSIKRHEQFHGDVQVTVQELGAFSKTLSQNDKKQTLQMTRITEEFANMQAHFAVLDQRYVLKTVYEEQRTSFERRVNEMYAELERKIEELMANRRGDAMSKANFDRLEKLLDNLDMRVAQLEGHDRAAMEAKIEILTTRLEQLRVQIDLLLKWSDDAKAAGGQTNIPPEMLDQLKNLVSEQANTKGKLDQLQNELAQLRDDNEGKFKDLFEKVGALRNDVDMLLKLGDALKSGNGDASLFEVKLNDMYANFDKLRKELEDLKARSGDDKSLDLKIQPLWLQFEQVRFELNMLHNRKCELPFDTIMFRLWVLDRLIDGLVALNATTPVGIDFLARKRLGGADRPKSAPVPPTPTNVVATPGNKCAHVSFIEPPSHPLGPIAAYRVIDPATGNPLAEGPKSPLTVKGLENGKDYPLSVIALNNTGASEPSYPVRVRPGLETVPSPPQQLVAHPGNGEAQLTFRPPAEDGGAPVEKYRAIHRVTGGTLAEGPSSPLTVTGLENGREYPLSVVAVNRVGPSAPAATDSVTPRNAATAPEAPTDVKAHRGDGKATVAFSPPANNGGAPITGYKVINPATGSPLGEGKSSPIITSPIDNGVETPISVVAINPIGVSPPSKPVLVTCGPGIAPPGPPRGVQATPDDQKGTIYFLEPTDNGGAPITGYDIVDAKTSDKLGGGVASPITLAPLQNDKEYNVRVVARNQAGPSAPSSAVRFTPAKPGQGKPDQEAVPDAPTHVQATPGDQKANVSFVEPAFRGSAPIQAYRVVDEKGQPLAEGTTSPITVYGLENGKPKPLAVVAVNKVGPSVPSSAATVTPRTGATVPDAPSSVQATRGDGRAAVAFAVPQNNGGQPITGYKVINPTTGAVLGSGDSSPINVAPLDNGREHPLAVVATNSVGDSVPSTPVVVKPGSGASAPDAPTGLKATPGDGKATVSFTPPANNNGAPISGYKVIDPKSGNPLGESASSPVTASGLENGKEKPLAVVAVNPAGQSAPSLPVLVTPSSGITPPGEPTNLAAKPGDGQATVYFLPPTNDGGSPVTGYEILDAKTGASYGEGKQSPIVIGPLENGVEYLVNAVARNQAGTSGPSKPVRLTPVRDLKAGDAASVPGSPTNVQATPGDKKAVVSFVEPAFRGSAPIQAYRVVDEKGNPLAEGAESPLTVTGLENGKPKSLAVMAVNKVGPSLPSVPARVTPAAGLTVPDPPTKPKATRGDRQALMAFDPPAHDGGAPVTKYLVVNPNNGAVLAAGDRSPITVPNLENGKEQPLAVVATNSVGPSVPSTPVKVTPGSGPAAPDAPTGLVAAPGDKQAVVSFKPPANDNGAPVSGYKVIDPKTGSPLGEGASSPVTASGLENGKEKPLAVVAVNPAGQSAPSLPVLVTPASGPTVPGEPTALQACPENGQAKIYFLEPTNNGGSPITGYEIVDSKTGRPLASGAASPITIKPLDNGTEYIVSAVARNRVGPSKPSMAVRVTPGLDGEGDDGAAVPGAPTNVQATPGDKKAIVSFLEPKFRGSAPIQAYRVHDAGGVPLAEGAKSPIVVPNLENGVMYPLSVVAVNKVGPSEESVPARVTPLPGPTVPDPPTDLKAQRGDKQATLFFTPPVNDGGAPLTGFVAVDAASGTPVGQAERSPITVTGLENGRPYKLSVLAKNKHGNSVPATPVTLTPGAGMTVPDAPTDLTAARGDRSAKVAFQPPMNNGGAPISGYKVIDPKTGKPLGEAASSPVTASGLENGKEKPLAVVAFNPAGQSAPSHPVLVTPFGALTPPGEPTNLSAAPGDGKAKLFFLPPTNDGGDPVDGYVAIDEKTGKPIAEGLASPLTLQPLDNDVEYVVSVVAKNKAGKSNPSKNVRFVPRANPQATVPNPPTNLMAQRGDGTATVSFLPPIRNGGAYITGYRLVDSKSGQQVGEATQSPITATGLANGQPYTLHAVAVNRVGPSAASVPVTVTPNPLTVPDPPTNLQVTPGDKRANLAFLEPVNTGGVPIAAYKVLDAKTQEPRGEGAQSPITLTGLENDKEYPLTVIAINRIGASKPSEPITITPRAGVTVPDPPTALQATTGDRTASIAFNPPLNNGGAPVLGYRAVHRQTGEPLGEAAESPIKLHGLTNHKELPISVVAFNRVGPSVPAHHVRVVPSDGLHLGAPLGATEGDGTGLGDDGAGKHKHPSGDKHPVAAMHDELGALDPNDPRTADRIAKMRDELAELMKKLNPQQAPVVVPVAAPVPVPAEVPKSAEPPKEPEKKGFPADRQAVLDYLNGPGKALLKGKPVTEDDVNDIFDKGLCGDNTLPILQKLHKDGVQADDVPELIDLMKDANAELAAAIKEARELLRAENPKLTRGDVEKLFAGCGNRPELLDVLKGMKAAGTLGDFAHAPLAEQIAKGNDELGLDDELRDYIRDFLNGKGASLLPNHKEKGKLVTPEEVKELIAKGGAGRSTLPYLRRFRKDHRSYPNIDALAEALANMHKEQKDGVGKLLDDPSIARMFTHAGPKAAWGEQKYGVGSPLGAEEKGGAGSAEDEQNVPKLPPSAVHHVLNDGINGPLTNDLLNALKRQNSQFDGLHGGVPILQAQGMGREDFNRLRDWLNAPERVLMNPRHVWTPEDVEKLLKVGGGKETLPLLKKFEGEGRQFKTPQEVADALREALKPTEEQKHAILAYLNDPSTQVWKEPRPSVTMAEIDSVWLAPWTVADIETLAARGMRFPTFNDLVEAMRRRYRMIELVSIITTETTTTHHEEFHDDDIRIEDLPEETQEEMRKNLTNYVRFEVRAESLSLDEPGAVPVIGELDPYVEIYRQRAHIWEMVGRSRTEVASSSPDFGHLVLNVKHVVHDDLNRKLLFKIFDANVLHSTWTGAPLIGQFATTIYEMLHSPSKRYPVVDPGKKVSKPGYWYSNSGNAVIPSAQMCYNITPAAFTLTGPRVFTDNVECWLKFEMMAINVPKMTARGSTLFFELMRRDGLGKWSPIYSSEYVNDTKGEHNSIEYRWAALTMTMANMCRNDLQLPLRLQVWHSDNTLIDNYVGSFEGSPKDFLTKSTIKWPLVHDVKTAVVSAEGRIGANAKYTAKQKETPEEKEARERKEREEKEEKALLKNVDFSKCAIVWNVSGLYTDCKVIEDEATKATNDLSSPLAGVNYIGEARTGAYLEYLFHGKSVHRLVRATAGEQMSAEDLRKRQLEIARENRNKEAEVKKEQDKQRRMTAVLEGKKDVFKKSVLARSLMSRLTFQMSAVFEEELRSKAFLEVYRYRDDQWAKIVTTETRGPGKFVWDPLETKEMALATNVDIAYNSPILIRMWVIEEESKGSKRNVAKQTRMLGEAKLTLAELKAEQNAEKPRHFPLVNEELMLLDPTRYDASGYLTFTKVKSVRPAEKDE